MVQNINAWKKNWSLVKEFFSTAEINSLMLKIKHMKLNHLVYCSFENRFAKSGGLAAVTLKILPYLKEINRIPSVILLTPFYTKLTNPDKLLFTGKKFDVNFNGEIIPVEIYKYINEYSTPGKGMITEYFLKAGGFFESKNRVNDPYIYVENNDLKNAEKILLNAMFYCKSVPLALQALGIDQDLILHLQDWQTALISLTSKDALIKNILKSCGTIQTMHNSFDSHIPWELLSSLIDSRRFENLIDLYPKGLTAYQIGLQLVDAPVNTVSDNFAKEFTTDIIQTEHFAPHLQKIFNINGVCGVNNGMFVDFPDDFRENNSFTIDDIRKIKLKRRNALLKILAEYHPDERFGDLNYQDGSIINLPENIPIFVMSGRLDLVQKGYDIFLRAIERFNKDEIKVILTPLPVKSSDLDYFHIIADKCNGNLTIFPIRMEKGFHELQIGSTYGVMPSVYEPFGAAVEYMVNGTVNIARATGGLVDQVDDPGCGILYREQNDYNLRNIKRYSRDSECVQSRETNSWANSMVDVLYEAICRATDLYQNHTDDYYYMVKNGFRKVQYFSWENSAKQYYKLFHKVTEGF